MFPDVDIEVWLRAHSSSWRRDGNELIFVHHTGETSILNARGAEVDLLRLKSPLLQPFYDRYLGASIGDSQIMIACSVKGGIETSHDYVLPDLEEMRKKVSGLGVSCGADDEVFMVEAAWMFAYAFRQLRGSYHLMKFDRDLGTERIYPGVKDALESWWQLLVEDV